MSEHLFHICRNSQTPEIYQQNIAQLTIE